MPDFDSFFYSSNNGLDSGGARSFFFVVTIFTPSSSYAYGTCPPKVNCAQLAEAGQGCFLPSASNYKGSTVEVLDRV